MRDKTLPSTWWCTHMSPAKALRWCTDVLILREFLRPCQQCIAHADAGPQRLWPGAVLKVIKKRVEDAREMTFVPLIQCWWDYQAPAER